MADIVERLQRDCRAISAGADGQRQRVKDKILAVESIGLRRAQDLFGNGNSPGRRLRNSRLIERECNDKAAVFFCIFVVAITHQPLSAILPDLLYRNCLWNLL